MIDTRLERVNPFLRPIFFISKTAGIVVIATPRIISVAGRVTRLGEGAISILINPPTTVTKVTADNPIACARKRR